MPFLPLPPRTVGALGRKRFVGEFHTRGVHPTLCCCLISSFYIKPQQVACMDTLVGDCLISSFYIKPQRFTLLILRKNIVLYRLSTSNHNFQSMDRGLFVIVLYRLSTSNHNSSRYFLCFSLLSYIVFLHQTTTMPCGAFPDKVLSYIVFLHQTTTTAPLWPGTFELSYIVFLHQTTTGDREGCFL